MIGALGFAAVAEFERAMEKVKAMRTPDLVITDDPGHVLIARHLLGYVDGRYGLTNPEHESDPDRAGWSGGQLEFWMLKLSGIPDFPNSLDACAVFEKAIAEKGWQDVYLNMLARSIAASDISKPYPGPFEIATATPAQRMAAAVSTIKGLGLEG